MLTDSFAGFINDSGQLLDQSIRSDGANETGSGIRLRVMAANLTSGNHASYDDGPGARILQGLKPDVILIQEFIYQNNSDADIRSFVDTTFSTSFDFYRQPSVALPNGIISRYPIIQAGVWDDPLVEDREFVWAQIDIPGNKDLWAVSLHLLTSNAIERNSEALTLVDLVRQHIPAQDYLVIGGDLNTKTRDEDCITTLAQVIQTIGSLPADGQGNSNTNITRSRPYDWVLADSDLHPLQIATLIGAAKYTTGLVFDSRIYTPLADVPPVQAEDSEAINMQHMAVVKDFLIPAEAQ
jgi:endonuclease/exonuclease/phosphatase family metal-dependent hydrolase